MTQESFEARLAHALAAKNMTGAALATAVNVSAGAVSQWLSGAKAPRRDKVAEIAAVLDVDQAWLEFATGRGPAIDLDAARQAYHDRLEWDFREEPPDAGRDLGNATIFVFDPKPDAFAREVIQNVLDVIRGNQATLTFR